MNNKIVFFKSANKIDDYSLVFSCAWLYSFLSIFMSVVFNITFHYTITDYPTYISVHSHVIKSLIFFSSCLLAASVIINRFCKKKKRMMTENEFKRLRKLSIIISSLVVIILSYLAITELAIKAADLPLLFIILAGFKQAIITWVVLSIIAQKMSKKYCL